MANKAENKEMTNQIAVVQNFELTNSNGELINSLEVFSKDSDFEELVEEFLSKEFLEENKDVQFRAIIRETVNKTIDSKEKEFAVLEILTESGFKPFLAGQFKFLQAFKEKNKGNGIALIWSFKGKISIKGGKKMNDFYIAVKAL